MTDLAITSGDAYEDDRRLSISVTNADGSATNLAGVTLRFMAKEHRRDVNDDAVLDKSTTDGIEITNDVGGEARITLTPSDTEDLDGIYWWELQGEDAVGIITLASGRLFVARGLVV